MDSFQETFSFISNGSHALILSIPLGASCITAILSGPIADRIGRKKFVWIACVIHLIGTITQTVVKSFTPFLVGKLIAGVSIGMLSVMCPLYQSEISLPEHRGRLISMHQFGVTVGFCIAFWITYGTFNLKGELPWRVPFGLQIMPPFIMMVGVYFIPESPRWLISQGKFSEAKDILQRLRCKKDQHDLDLSMEYTGMIQERNYDRKYSSKSYKSLLTRGIDNNKKRTTLGVGLHVMTQLTGINAFMFYLPYILESTGIVETNSALLSNGISGMVNMLATIPSFLYIDKWGRKPIMITGAIVMATCMSVIAIIQGIFFEHIPSGAAHAFKGSSFPIAVYTRDGHASFAMLVILCLYLACFALSWGSMGWIYPAEIYPQSIRAKGLGITTGASFATSIFVSQIAPVLFKNIEWGTYLFFGALCLIESYLVHIIYPETKVYNK
ncbi:MAG: general substrate transporter [Benjaminiella poitrasii]|nr:MAG: general substrate transporter [Benjaminiella poitrasii]